MKLFRLVGKLIALLIAVTVIVDGVVLAVGQAHMTTNLDKLEKADCILVLGAAVNSDGTPSAMLQDRLDKAIELYKDGYADKLLLSGDNGQVEYNEVGVMKQYAQNQGVPDKDIFLDHAGFSTYESMYRAQAIFNVHSAIVVTQRYHEYRALFIGTVLGMDVTGVPAEHVSYEGWQYREAREVLARVKDCAQSILRLKPTYLGDVIDISGDGRASWD